MSGGAVIDPPRTVFDVTDYEDNLILDLVVAVDARILVSADTDLTSMNPWDGQLIVRPKEFVRHAVPARRTNPGLAPVPTPKRPSASPQGRAPKGSTVGGEFTTKQQSDPEVSLSPDD